MSTYRLLIQMAAIFSSIFVLGSLGWHEPAQAAQDEKGIKSGGSGDVTLKIAGDKGTRFSGVCLVGQEEHKVSGRVPQSFEYDLNDRRLECEIRKRDARGAELKVVLKDENTSFVQRSAGGGDTTMRLAYENDSLSSSVSSSSLQKLSGAGSSSSSAVYDAAQGVDDQESLADQIQTKVDEILEKALP